MIFTVILIFLLLCLVAVLFLMVFQMVGEQKKGLVEYEITSHAELQSALMLKETFKAALKMKIGCVESMTRFELWAWSMALREIVIEMNQSQIRSDVAANT